MDELEKQQINRCIGEIKAYLYAIEIEMNGNPHKSYILEKIKPIIWDSNVIKFLCEGE